MVSILMAEIIHVISIRFLTAIFFSFLVIEHFSSLKIVLTRWEGGNLCLGVCAYSAKGKKSEKISDNYNIFLGKNLRFRSVERIFKANEPRAELHFSLFSS